LQKSNTIVKYKLIACKLNNNLLFCSSKNNSEFALGAIELCAVSILRLSNASLKVVVFGLASAKRRSNSNDQITRLLECRLLPKVDAFWTYFCRIVGGKARKFALELNHILLDVQKSLKNHLNLRFILNFLVNSQLGRCNVNYHILVNPFL
jgi:hypothetical protein